MQDLRTQVCFPVSSKESLHCVETHVSNQEYIAVSQIPQASVHKHPSSGCKPAEDLNVSVWTEPCWFNYPLSCLLPTSIYSEYCLPPFSWCRGPWKYRAGNKQCWDVNPLHRENMVSTHGGTSFHHKEKIWAFCRKMNETGDHLIKWTNLATERQCFLWCVGFLT